MTHLALQPIDIFFYPGKDTMTLAFLLLNNLKRPKIKLVTHVLHEINANHQSDKSSSGKILRQSIDRADAVAGNSQFVSQGIKDYFSKDAYTIYDPIDQRHFYSEPKKSQNFSALYAGSFQERKRPWMVIEAAQRHPNIKFDLVGKGPLEDSCKALATQLNCKNVEFHGHVTPAELGKLMRASDIFLFPSIFEGLPQVLGQAAACGLPVVAMACYKPDTVDHNSTGFLAQNDEEFCSYFDLLCNDTNLRTQFSKQAIIHTKKFSTQEAANNWSNIFLDLMNKEK